MSESTEMLAAASTAPPRVIFLINSMEGGGAERIVALLLQEFQHSQPPLVPASIDLVLLDDASFAYAIPEGVPVETCDARGSLPRSVLGLYRVLRRRRPALVVSHLARANFAATLLCRRLGIPCLIMEHVNTSSHFSGKNFYSWVSKRLVRWLYPRADQVIAVSEGVAADLAAHYAVPPAAIKVIPTPFDVDRIQRSAKEMPAMNLPESFVVAVGRLTPNKNFALLLDAYAAAGIAQQLVILGQGEEYASLRQRAHELGIEERVVFLGFVTNPYGIIQRAAAFVSSSNAEGFPVAAGEALVLARPVLMTDCPSGPAELLGGSAPPGAGVVRGRYGLLTPVGDRDAFAEGLHAVVAPEMSELAERGQERMEACRPNAVARQHAESIRRFLGDAMG